VIAAESLRNHVGSQRGVVGAALLAVHLVAVAVWVGTLAHLLRVAYANRGRSARTMRAFVMYSRLALWVFLVVAVTGTVAALLLVPSVGALTGTAYGRVLIVKLALVVAVVVLAWIGRRRLRRPPAALTTATRGEAAMLVGVLGVSAVLVGLPTPAPATADLGYPPPISGPAIRLGTLAGQIAVGIAASENRLEVRLRVPDTGDELGAGRPPGYKLSTRVSSPGRAAAVTALQPCGPGCFVGPVQWRPGVSYVDLRVDADEWQGGSALFPIHWAPSAARDVLPKVRAAMAAQTSIRVTEAVTSDTSRPAPKPRNLTTNGREFLSSEPYGSPPDPEVVLPSGPQRPNLLAFALPAEGIYVELEIDASYRIIRETLAAPKHLTERTFAYPR
jgi:copper transport protein